MTEEEKFNAQRLIIARYFLDSFKDLAEYHWSEKRYGSIADEVMMNLAIYVGQVELKPLNAFKLAEYVGIPRSTVIRKIQTGVERGFLIENPDGTVQIADLHNEAMLEQGHKAIARLIVACREVSKMDT